MLKKISAFLFLLLFSNQILWAHDDSTDFLRSTGKIYAVVAVIVIIFLGIAIYLYRLDNKLTKLENQINNEQ